MNNIAITWNNGYLKTSGLSSKKRYEISLKTTSTDNSSLLEYIIQYMLDNNKTIQPEETLAYGLWLIKLTLKQGYLEIYELDTNFNSWKEGAEYAIYYYEMQKQVCSRENVSLEMPMFTQLIAVSDGVLDENVLNLKGIRYSEPSHMSGWYITSDKYSGNIKDLRVIPIQDLVAIRKDILQFLALPIGFFFEIFEDQTCDVRKIPEILLDTFGN